MAHARKKTTGLYPRLDMTPMIDVVFQLLIFFVIAIKHEDILSKLTATRPAIKTDDTTVREVELIDIRVSSQGFVINGRPVSKAELDRRMEAFSIVSQSALVTIKCTADSPHAFLVQSLDICNKYGMTNLSIFSM